MTNRLVLFTNQTANGSSVEFAPVGTGASGQNNSSILNVFGVFGGCSLQLEFYENSAWYSTGDVAISASRSLAITQCSNNPYRLTLSGATGTTSISAVIYDAA
jgi:hypothetical protein